MITSTLIIDHNILNNIGHITSTILNIAEHKREHPVECVRARDRGWGGPTSSYGEINFTLAFGQFQDSFIVGDFNFPKSPQSKT